MLCHQHLSNYHHMYLAKGAGHTWVCNARFFMCLRNLTDAITSFQTLFYCIDLP